MSIQIILLIVAAALVACGLYSSIRDKRLIKRLRNGQAQWRDIAFHHSRAAVSAGNEAHLLAKMLMEMEEILTIRDEGFKRLVVHLWGAPLDRTLQDVLDRYDMLLRVIQSDSRAKETLAEVAIRQDAQIKALKERAEQWERQAKTNAILMQELMRQQWALRQIPTNKEEPPRFGVYDASGITSLIATGQTPEAAMQAADEKIS